MSVPSRVIVPMVDLEQNSNPHHKVVMKGVKQITTNTLTADSSNNTQALWSFQPPSQNSIIDRRFLLRCEMNVLNNNGVWASNGNYNVAHSETQFVPALAPAVAPVAIPAGGGNTPNVPAVAQTTTQVNDGSRAVKDNLWAPRQLPLMSCIEVIDIEINGTHISVSPSDYIHALMKYTTPEFREKYLSATASYPDTYAEYTSSYGNDEHPFRRRGAVGRKGEQPRGAFGSSGNGTANLRYVFTEPLFISPLLVGGEFEGLTNVNQINVSIRWGDLRRMFSAIPSGDAIFGAGNTQRTIANGVNVVGDYVVSFASTPELLINYYTAQDDIAIPNEIILPYNQPQVYIKTMANVGANANVGIVGDNIRINQIPQKVFIFASRSRATRTPFTSDCVLGCNSINVNWNNQVGILSNATPQELHKLSVENGLDSYFDESGEGTKGSLEDWGGAPVCLEFGKDLPLETNESVGTHGNYNLRIDANFRNASGAQVSPEYYIVLVMNGSCIVSPNECRLTLGNLDSSENAMAESMGLTYHHLKHEGMFGGSRVGGGFLSGLKHFAKKGLNLAGGLASACEKYAPMIKKGVKVGSAVVGGSSVGGSNVGGSYVGGSNMTSRRR